MRPRKGLVGVVDSGYARGGLNSLKPIQEAAVAPKISSII
jgi:hypothetical protein